MQFCFISALACPVQGLQEPASLSDIRSFNQRSLGFWPCSTRHILTTGLYLHVHRSFATQTAHATREGMTQRKPAPESRGTKARRGRRGWLCRGGHRPAWPADRETAPPHARRHPTGRARPRAAPAPQHCLSHCPSAARTLCPSPPAHTPRSSVKLAGRV